ncbi:MAG: hypothetical protein K5896_03585 [Prevotella sp.]|nr:hypothetical protein [Prevotella sp.]
MIKKKYMQPALEVSQAEVDEIIAVSMTSVQTSGLDDNNLNIDDEKKDGNPWEDAW